MHIDLTGCRALVTGASSGIGRATAIALAEAGAAVVVAHHGEPSAAAAVKSLILGRGQRAETCEADLSTPSGVHQLAAFTREALGGCDLLVNNAGVVLVKPFLEVTEAEYDRVLAVDLKAVFLLTQALLPGMLEQGHGVVVNVASELGYLGRALYTPYTAAKGGVLSLTRSLAREFAPTIRVNAVAPGPTDTPMLASEHAITDGLEAEVAIPAGRLAHPGEIARTVVFLASEAASFYHGECLSPNGGALMR